MEKEKPLFIDTNMDFKCTTLRDEITSLSSTRNNNALGVGTHRHTRVSANTHRLTRAYIVS